VNDRPYVASSFMSVALASVFRSALKGQSRERPELAESSIPLEARIAVLPCRGGEGLLRRLFEPLGYALTAEQHPLDETHPEWGPSPYFTVTLSATCRLRDLLTHLYVLIPVLDRDKHYWIGEDEVEKLIRHGEGWLAGHPEREQITRRYLKQKPDLVRDALARLVDEAPPEIDAVEAGKDREEEAIEEPIRLNGQRMAAVAAALREKGARTVLDLGCGEGRLIRELMKERGFERIVGVDISYRTLEMATRRLHLDRLPPTQADRVKLLYGSLTYRDRRLEGFDAAAVVEVILASRPSSGFCSSSPGREPSC
jgi:3' terminal RNA ribose 2'-O-methyltransferase Hen1